MHKENWDDIRFALAVAENGSVSAAARLLGVNHATVLRRVAAFEERHANSIFEKSLQGYTVAPDRLKVIEAMREVESSIQALRRVIEGASVPLRGVVRVTSTDTFCSEILPSALADLRKVAQSLRVDLICSNAHLNMGRLAADITVRPAISLEDDLTGSVAARLGFGVYEGADCPDYWLGLSGDISRSPAAQWMAKDVPPDQIAASGDSFVTLAQMARAGMGRAVLPCIIGDRDQGLTRVKSVMPAMAIDIWVACHLDLVDVPRIRVVRDFMIRSISARADELLGDPRFLKG